MRPSKDGRVGEVEVRGGAGGDGKEIGFADPGPRGLGVEVGGVQGGAVCVGVDCTFCV